MVSQFILVSCIFDASRSSPIYKDNAHVQEEAVQYPYFIQVANGSEEEIDPVREIEFNNPFYYGMYKWSEIIPANLSWLEADNTFQDGTVYVDFYDWILKNQSGAISSGISVKNSDEAYTDYDFVIDATNQTFRLPTKTAIRELIAVKEPTSADPSWYRLYSDGWVEQGGIISKFTNTGANTGYPNVITLSIKMQNTNYDVRAMLRANDDSVSHVSGWSYRELLAIPVSVNSIQIDQYANSAASGTQTYASWEVKGYAASDASPNLGLKLYWYVGETVQNAHLINAANLMDSVTDYVDELTEQTESTMDALVAKVIDEGNKQWAKVNMEGLHIFDIVQKDHRLSFAESNGFAELGTWVWKEGVSDSRYGYPDFYDVCLAEYNNSTEGGYLASNVEYVGSVNDNLGILSGFSTTNYVYVGSSTTTFNPGSNPWEVCIKFTTGSDVTTDQYIIVSGNISNYGTVDLNLNSSKFKLCASSNGTSGNIADHVAGTYIVLANTTYWVKMTFDGSKYVLSYSLDGENFTTDITVTNSTVAIQNRCFILGTDYASSAYVSPFLGSIDLTQCYIKIAGEYWWKGIRQARINNNGHIYYDVADKELVDAIYDKNGIAWMYGIDTENERVFLPRRKHGALVGSHISADGISWYRLYEDGWVEQGGFPTTTSTVTLPIEMRDVFYWQDVHMVANTNNNITFSTRGYDLTTTGFKYNNASTPISSIRWEVEGYSAQKTISLNHYMIVGSVTEETAIGQYVEVTTTENDTIPLFKDEYFEFIPEHISWAPANTIKDGNEYLTAYNQLVNLLNPVNNTKQLKVIDEDDMETGVDYSEYWIVNQTNVTFRTPVTVSKKALDGGVKGNGKTLGFTNGTSNFGYSGSTGDNNNASAFRLSAYDVAVSSTASGGTTTTGIIGVTTDASKSGIIAQESSTSKLYFKVGNAVQNLQLIDVGRLEENKANTDASNFNQTGKSQITKWSLPSSHMITLVTGASGTPYEAPANGYFYVSTGAATSNGFALWYHESKGYMEEFGAPQSIAVNGITRVSKGEVVKLNYANLPAVAVYFIYAEGEENV